LNLSVTRSNLLRLREELDFAQEGYELLEQKREVLVMEVMSLIEKLREWKKQAEASLQAAYRALEEANVVLGKESVTRASLAIGRGKIRCGRSIISVWPLVATAAQNPSPVWFRDISPAWTRHSPFFLPWKNWPNWPGQSLFRGHRAEKNSAPRQLPALHVHP
jgi:hypothetical protein